MAVRVYFVISTTLSPTVNQWRTVLNAAKSKPLAAAIITAARAAQNFISVDKFSQGATHVNKNVMGVFEIESNQVDNLLAVLNTRADAIGVSGTDKAKFAAVLQSELRAAATENGFSGAQANTMTVTVLNTGANQFDPSVAAATARAYLATNAAIWAQTIA